jgi:nucleoid DNA-binding protein
LEALVEVTTNTLKSGDRLALVGFGTISISDKKKEPVETFKLEKK